MEAKRRENNGTGQQSNNQRSEMLPRRKERSELGKCVLEIHGLGRAVFAGWKETDRIVKRPEGEVRLSLLEQTRV